MELFFLIFLFVLGSAVGSFLNVLIDRIPKNKSVFLSRSVCEKCLKQIFIFDLIPIFSYLILNGKCRNCKSKITSRILFVEMTSAILFPLSFFFGFANPLQFVLLLGILLTLIVISTVDMEEGIIPDKLLLVMGFLSVIYLFPFNLSLVLSHLFTGACAFIFFLLIFVLTRGKGMGFGDVKYAFFIGFLLSTAQIFIAFYTAFLTGALVSMILIMLGIKKIKGETVPFGPFLSFGIFTALLFERQILEIVHRFLIF